MTHHDMNTPTPDYGELWTIQEGPLSTSLVDGKGAYFADIHELVNEDSSVAWAKAERIVACVNACAKMADPAKEIAAMREAHDQNRKAYAELEMCEKNALAELSISNDERDHYRRENATLRQALSGRTVSCGQCNDYAAENKAMREAIREAHNAIKASPYPDQQALAKLQPFLK